MLKHVQVSPLRARADSLSIRSCASSFCGSPEPLGSRTSSYSSLSETTSQTTIKIFTQCLRQDIEYKTLSISFDTTCREVIAQVLRRCKMRHRDPRLFYLTMEVTMRRAGVRTCLVLDEAARPGALQSCHPRGDSRFCLQARRGGLVKVHDSAIFSSSQYKSLLISEKTTSDELLSLLLSCYNSLEPVEQFSLYEVCPVQEYQRKLHPDDLPLRAQAAWSQRGHTPSHFLVRRNPDYRPLSRRKQLTPCVEHIPKTEPTPNPMSLHSLTLSPMSTKSFDMSTNKNKERLQDGGLNKYAQKSVCKVCKNSFKSCEFCSTNITSSQSCGQINCYSPVYQMRTINYNLNNNTLSSSFNAMKLDSNKTNYLNKSNVTGFEKEERKQGDGSSTSAASTSGEPENYFYI